MHRTFLSLFHDFLRGAGRYRNAQSYLRKLISVVLRRSTHQVLHNSHNNNSSTLTVRQQRQVEAQQQQSDFDNSNSHMLHLFISIESHKLECNAVDINNTYNLKHPQSEQIVNVIQIENAWCLRQWKRQLSLSLSLSCFLFHSELRH